jgi:hypothetical protein
MIGRMTVVQDEPSIRLMAGSCPTMAKGTPWSRHAVTGDQQLLTVRRPRRLVSVADNQPSVGTIGGGGQGRVGRKRATGVGWTDEKSLGSRGLPRSVTSHGLAAIVAPMRFLRPPLERLVTFSLKPLTDVFRRGRSALPARADWAWGPRRIQRG